MLSFNYFHSMGSHTYIFTSSRGKTLEGKINCEYIEVIPGGKLNVLCDIAYKKLKNVEGRKLVYFVAGIPDICTLDKIRKHKYEESYLKQIELKDHIQRIKSVLKRVEFKMKCIDCTVVYATITTMSFESWNFHRLEKGKTVFLKYQAEYPAMQKKLNDILHEINNFITCMNTKNGVVTPFLHSPVQKCSGGTIRYLYSKLVDGVHPTPELAAVWVRRMNSTVRVNEIQMMTSI